MKFKKSVMTVDERVYRLKFFTGRIFENLAFRVLQFGNSVSPAAGMKGTSFLSEPVILCYS